MSRFTPAVVALLGLAALPVSVYAQAISGAKPEAAHEKHWGYEDSAESVGPAKWGTLSGDATCGTGTQQTPINLSAGAAKPQDLANLLFGYKPSALSMTNNGHTVQMTYDAGSSLGRVGSTNTWTLAQFHFHAPSEHTVDGKSYPLEMHLVHVDSAGKAAAVVGVFLSVGHENVALARAFKQLPAKANDKIAPAGEKVNASALLPADKTFFTYPGSLTTPPCSEGITWFVMKNPIEVAQWQVSSFVRLEHLAHTNRPLQSVGTRVVLVDSTPGK